MWNFIMIHRFAHNLAALNVILKKELALFMASWVYFLC